MVLTNHFFTFEGGEGSGKTTAIERIAEYLEERGYDVLITREPGGSEVAEEIREMLLKERTDEMDAMTEAILFVASRNEHLTKTVMPALKAGKIVLMDRYVDSSLTYQGVGRGLGIDTIWQLNAPIVERCMPIRTFLLDVEPRVGLDRIVLNNREMNRLDKESLEFHERIMKGYHAIAERFNDRITIIDANRSESEVFMQIEAVMFQMLRGNNNG